MSKLKATIWIVGMAPTIWLGLGFFRGYLGSNPIESIILVEGRWSLGFILATLAVSPLRSLTGWNPIIKVRRLVGLFAFFHTSLHFMAYVGLDQFFAITYILEDVVERRYITAGFLGFLVMIPLALTSTRGWIRRLGRRWAKLHRLVYFAGGLGVLHFYWKVKADTFWPLATAAILVGLLALRLRGRRTRRGGLQQTSSEAQVSN